MIRSLCLITLLICSGSCVYTTENVDVRDVRVEPGVTTKEDLIQQLGTPAGFRLQGEDTVLVFRYVEVNGTGFGLGTAITAVLAIESTHGALDHLEVTIGPDRKVRSYRMAETPHETPIWPSDD